jgi:hypothetical protein
MINIWDDKIVYIDGFRSISLPWDDINRLEIIPSQWGERVIVIGSQYRFNFRTLGVVELQGREKGRMGFKDGEMIKKTIIENCNLVPSGDTREGLYYSRK